MYSKLYSFLKNLTPEFLPISDLLPIEEKIKELLLLDANKLQIVLMGEFKAGKSSLINALLQNTYAPSDILEMTAWIARYVKADTPFCQLRFEDGTSQPEDLAAFLEKCEKKLLSQAFLTKLSYVDIGVPEAPEGLILVDTPGLGTINTQNEQRLLKALQHADCLLWILDATAIGSLTDSAVFLSYQQIGLPVLVVVTKIDLLSGADEFDEIKCYLNRLYKIDIKEIIGISAQKALQQKHFKETGIEMLIGRLNNLQNRHQHIRQQALAAHEQGLKKHLVLCFDQAEQRLKKIKHDVKDGVDIIQKVSESIEENIKDKAAVELITQPLENAKPELAQALKTLIEHNELKEEKISFAFQNMQKNLNLDGKWNDFKINLTEHLKNAWKDKLRDLPLPAIWHDLTKMSDQQLSKSLSIHTQVNPQLVIQNSSADGLATSLQTTAAIAGLGSVFSVVSGQVAATAVLSTVALPVVLIGGIVAGGLYWLNNEDRQKQKKEQAEALADQLITAYQKELISQGLESQIMPLIKKYNQHIVLESKKALEKQQPNLGKIDNFLEEIRHWRQQFNL